MNAIRSTLKLSVAVFLLVATVNSGLAAEDNGDRDRWYDFFDNCQDSDECRGSYEEGFRDGFRLGFNAGFRFAEENAADTGNGGDGENGENGGNGDTSGEKPRWFGDYETEDTGNEDSGGDPEQPRWFKERNQSS